MQELENGLSKEAGVAVVDNAKGSSDCLCLDEEDKPVVGRRLKQYFQLENATFFGSP